MAQPEVRRFYKQAAVAPANGGGWQVKLDGRGVRTMGGLAQVVPNRAMAQALAAEWAAQGDEINTAAFPLRDLADYAIDAVAPGRDAVIAELIPYAETDTLCYRADPDEALFRRQEEIWEPLLTDAEARLGVRFTRVSGIVHRPQPQATLERLRVELAAMDDFTLAALRMLAGLAASLIVGLAATRPGADAEALWRAAELEADWQAALWGEDHEAAERRAARLAAFRLAMHMTELARQD